MAHFAEIDDNNIVIRVLVVSNDEESVWPVYPYTGRWVQTSYNNRIRKNFAGAGYTYDPVRDAFIPPKPYPSWLLDEDTCLWKAPTPKPDGEYYWDEDSISWKLFNRFIATPIDCGDFIVTRMTAHNVGDFAYAGEQNGMDRSSPTRISVVTKGARTHGPDDGSEPITLHVGDWNTILPDMVPGVRYKVTALTADTEYHCVSRKDMQPFANEKFNLSAGSTLEIPAGSNAMVCGDEVSIYSATAEARNILLSTDSFGLIFV